MTPIYVACQNGHIEVVKYLVEHGANINKGNNNNNATPLDIACEKGHEKVVKYLVEHGAYIHEGDNNDKSLFITNQNRQNNIEKYLIGIETSKNKKEKNNIRIKQKGEVKIKDKENKIFKGKEEIKVKLLYVVLLL